MTQLATALRSAGYSTTSEQLRDIAVGALGVHGGNMTAAREAVFARVVGHADLLYELFKPYRDQALTRLINITRDRLAEESHRQQRPRQPPKGADKPAPRQEFGKLIETPRPTLAAAMLARTAAGREAQAAVGEVLRRSRLEMFRIDGRPLADLSVGAARGWALGRGREARWILLMTANMPPDFIVGRHVTADEADMFWRRARDDANE